MSFQATTTVAVLSAQATDEYGDPADDNTTPSVTGVEASIIEQRRTVFDSVDGQARIVRTTTGRVRSDVDVHDGYRLRDERSQQIYVVNSVDQVQSPVGVPDQRMDLTRVS